MTPINLVHDLLSPADRVGDGAHRGRDALSWLVLRQLSALVHTDQRGIFAFYLLDWYLVVIRNTNEANDATKSKLVIISGHKHHLMLIRR